MEAGRFLSRARIFGIYCDHYANHVGCPVKVALKRFMERLFPRFLENPDAVEAYFDDLGLESCGAESTWTSPSPHYGATDSPSRPTSPDPADPETPPPALESARTSNPVPPPNPIQGPAIEPLPPSFDSVEQFTCPVCMESIRASDPNSYTLVCPEGLHHFCLTCLYFVVQNGGMVKCPVCRNLLSFEEAEIITRTYERAHAPIEIPDDEEVEEELDLEQPPTPANSNSNANPSPASSGWISVNHSSNRSRGNPNRSPGRRSAKSLTTCQCCAPGANTLETAVRSTACDHVFNMNHLLRVMTRKTIKHCPKCKLAFRRVEVLVWNYKDYAISFMDNHRVMVSNRVTGEDQRIRPIKKRLGRDGDWYIEF